MLVQWRGHLAGLARLFVDAAFEECAHPPQASAVKRVEKFVPRRFLPAMAMVEGAVKPVERVPRPMRDQLRESDS